MPTATQQQDNTLYLNGDTASDLVDQSHAVTDYHNTAVLCPPTATQQQENTLDPKETTASDLKAEHDKAVYIG